MDSSSLIMFDIIIWTIKVVNHEKYNHFASTVAGALG